LRKTTNGDKLNPPLCNSLALLKLPRPHVIIRIYIYIKALQLFSGCPFDELCRLHRVD